MISFEKNFAGIEIFVLLVVVLISFSGGVSGELEVTKKVAAPPELQGLINPGKRPGGPTWLGADAATSVKITPDRYVWLFGDSILGKKENGGRQYSWFIHNTIGVATRNRSGNFLEIKKYYRKIHGKPAAIFSSKEDDHFYWPLVGADLDSSLLIAASKVTTKGSQNFSILGATIFRVKNPADPPKDWTYEKRFLPKEDGITWGSAILARNDSVYLFGQKGKGLSAMTVLSKISAREAKNDRWDDRQYFADGIWKKDSNPEALKGLPGTSETTIQHNSFFGWYCLQIPPFSFDVHLYTARRITDPWTDRGSVYEIPSPWSSEKTEKGKHVFSAYAAKSHPELAGEKNEIVLTYNVNLNPFVPGLSDKLGQYIGREKYSGLYIPRFVSLKFQRNSHP